MKFVLKQFVVLVTEEEAMSICGKALDINNENYVFFFTKNGREIVYTLFVYLKYIKIPDVSHILKLLRSWLLDTGFNRRPDK